MGTLGTFYEETQMNPVILIGCFTPLVLIFIVMKLAVWVSAVNSETDYVRREPLRKRGPYVENPYEDVDAEEEEYGDRTDYR
tara:strand:+ start:64 stop:309 length:246 start_codon:yes stop_codon:yes gene_type:complete